MEKANSYKRTLQSAAGCTAMLVLMLMSLARSKGGNGNSFGDVVLVLLPIAITIVSLLQWIKGTKQYIDYRFQKLKKEKSV
jgi:hypothetical protein